jgi:hypothetical protein
MEGSYNELAEQLQGSHVRVAKFQADVDRDFAQERFGLKTFPTIVMLPKAGEQVWARDATCTSCCNYNVCALNPRVALCWSVHSPAARAMCEHTANHCYGVCFAGSAVPK